MPKGPSPYKGVPRSEWGRVKAEQDALRAGNPANVLAEEIPSFIPEVSRETPAQQATAPLPKKPLNFDDPVDMFAGTNPKLKLYGKDGDDCDPVPGFATYWFEDDDSLQRVTLAKRAGWVPIQADEVLVAGNSDLGTGVSIGIPGSTPPRRMYAMKQPLELYNRFRAEREEKLHKPIWDMLKGKAKPRSLESAYELGPNAPKTRVEIETNR